MVLATAHWYREMPQVTQTGPLNEHFIRDYGTVFMLIGSAQLLALARGAFTRTMHVWILLFFVSHALIHVWDMAVGRLHDHLTTGFPLVLIPVAVLGGLLYPGVWESKATADERG